VANLLLAMAQGAVYTVGALLASRYALWLGQRRSLLVTFLALSAVSLLAASTASQAIITAVLLTYVLLVALTWPVLEAMSAATPDPHEMSRRIGIYNIVWAGAMTSIFPFAGTIIAHWPRGMFLIPLAVHAASAALLMIRPAISAGDDAVAEPVAPAHPPPEPELLRQRTLALWLSRIALPAMYVVSNALMAMMPSLPALKQMSPAWQTVFGGVWLVARWLMFLLLMATAFWHTRPRLMLAAAVGLLLFFLVVTVPPSRVLGPGELQRATAQQTEQIITGTWHQLDLTMLVVGQIGLGFAMGMIYMASLYFGMVLSDASTEHGGYHEALIGVGFVLGPAAALLSQTLWPQSVLAAALSVAGVVLISVVAAAIATLRMR